MLLRVLILLFIGAVVGLCARVVLPGRSPGGFGTTVLVGVGGALLAASVGSWLGVWHHGEAPGFFLSLAGAVVLLALYRAYKARTA